MKQVKCCNNCERGTAIHLTKDILCKYSGVVTPDYVCFKYRGLNASELSKQANFKCIHCDYFITDLDEANQNFGQCKLFSTRQFDGTTRNVCSKFSKRMLIDVG